MAASAAASGALNLCHSSSNLRRLTPATKLKGTVKFHIENRNRSFATVERSFPIRAVDSQKEENTSLDEGDGPLIPQEDFNFLWKLGAGSFVSAAIIKYGSILFPEITKPNIVQALLMVSTPVVISVLLLIKQSRVKQ